jgi:hypothetical protein
LRRVAVGRLHVLRGGRAAARSAVELLLVVAALDLLGMGLAGVGWLSAAWAVGLLAGLALVERRGQIDPAYAVAAGLALIGIPLALLALEPAEGVALLLLVAVGAGFALVLDLDRRALGPRPALDREELVDAIARTLGTTAAATLVVWLGDGAALVAAGAVAVALAAGALSVGMRVRGQQPAAARG